MKVLFSEMEASRHLLVKTLTFVLIMMSGHGHTTNATWFNNISNNLRADLSDVLDMVTVNYYEPVLNGSYRSNTYFNMRGMAPLYNSTGIVIDFLANKQAYPDGMVMVSDWHLEVVSPQENWRALLIHYAGPISVIFVAALLIILLPIVGFCWCCCQWCRGGRRRRPFDRKYDGCVKGLLAVSLIAFLTLFLFGVVCAFATEQQVEAGSHELPDSVRVSMKDIKHYLNETQAHARWILVVNYQQLEETLLAMLHSSGVKVSVQLGEFSRAASVTTLNKMVQDLDRVQADLVTVRNVTARLRYNAERLNSGLRKVKAQLLQTLANCEQPQCRRLQEKYKIGQLDTEIQYSQMPDVTQLLNNVTELIEGDIKREVAEGQEVFTNIKRGIEQSVDRHIPNVKVAITNTGQELRRIADEITSNAEIASAWASDNMGAATDTLRYMIGEYGASRRYLGLAVATSLLAMTCAVALGLLCGVCGKRPDAYGANDCCNKGSGSRWLLCGVGLMFALGGVIAAILIVYFVTGVATQRFVCDPLNEPRGNRFFSDMEHFVDFEYMVFSERKDPSFNMSSVIAKCHKNLTIYEVFNLQRVYDLEELQKRVESELEQRIDTLRPAYPARNIVILKSTAKQKLLRLADTGLSDFHFDRILQALETNITSLELGSLSRQLEATARELSGRVGFESVTMELHDAAAMLSAYQKDIVDVMLTDTTHLNRTALHLRDGLRFNHSSFKQAVSYLLDETGSAEQFLSTQGPQLIQNLTRDFAESVAKAMRTYLRRVISAAKNDVGRCGTMSKVYNATINSTCRKILMPINGFWMSLAWCILLFAPMMVVCVKLARLYLHLESYPGPIVEAEYLYDAYADRDNVPLANAYKAEKRSRREVRGGYAGEGGCAVRGGSGGAVGGGGGAGGGCPSSEIRRGEVGEGAAPPIDTHHSRRYNDMAPKHWEEGPPRYHGLTEYERPPPYYYPGPKECERQ